MTRSPASTTVLRLAQEPDIRPGESLAEHLARRTQVAAAQAALDASHRGADARRARRRRRLRPRRCSAGSRSAAPTCPSAWLRSPHELGLAAGLLEPRTRPSCPAASRPGSGWPPCCWPSPTSCCSTSRPTTWTTTAWPCSRPACGAARPGSRWSATTGPCWPRSSRQILELDEFTRHRPLFAGGWDAYVAERDRARRRAVDAYAGYETERDKLTEAARQQRQWAALRRAAGR